MNARSGSIYRAALAGAIGAAIFSLWCGIQLAQVVADPVGGPAEQVETRRLRDFSTQLREELGRADGGATRLDRVCKSYEDAMLGRLPVPRGASDLIFRACLLRPRMALQMPAERRAAVDSEFKGYVHEALSEINTAISDSVHPPVEILRDERRARSITLLGGLSGGLIAFFLFVWVLTNRDPPRAVAPVPVPAEPWLRAALESSGEAVVVFDENLTVRQWTGSAAKMFGYGASEIVGKSGTLLLPSLTPRKLERWSSTDQPEPHKETARPKGGGALPILLRGVRSGGNTVAYFTPAPVIEPVKVVSGPEFDGAFLAAPVPMMLVDSAGLIVRLNRSCETLLEYDSGEVARSCVFDVFLPTEKAEPARLEFQSDRTRFEQSWRTRTGKTVPLGWTREAVRDERGNAVQWVMAAATDPDFTRRLAETAGTSFRNQLTVINGYSELVDCAVAADDPVRRDIDEIRRAGERAALLAEQLQIYGRGPEAEEPVALVAIDLNAFVRDKMPRVGSVLSQRIRVHFEAGGPAVACAEPTLLEPAVLGVVCALQEVLTGSGTITIQARNGELEVEGRGRIAPNPALGALAAEALLKRQHGQMSITYGNGQPDGWARYRLVLPVAADAEVPVASRDQGTNQKSTTIPFSPA